MGVSSTAVLVKNFRPFLVYGGDLLGYTSSWEADNTRKSLDASQSPLVLGRKNDFGNNLPKLPLLEGIE